MKEDEKSAHKLVLVVDDDPAIQQLLSLYLKKNDFNVITVDDGKSMYQWLNKNEPDLIIMDLSLPGEDGLSLTQQLRSKSNIPILILTANTDEIDRIIGLEIGADDYLSKPFNPRELLARIKSILRRSTISTSINPSPDSRTIMFDDFSLNIDNMEFKYKEKIISLTTGDMNLLIALATNPKKILTREQIMDLLNAGIDMPFDRSIDVRITRLRKKIEIVGSDNQIIQTIWGKGYRFNRDTTYQ